MSCVTNVILTFSIVEEEGDRMKEVNSYETFIRSRGFAAPIQAYPDAYPTITTEADIFTGGTRTPEQPIYVAAFNHLPLKEFLQHIRTKVRWEEPENVRCFVCDEGEEAFNDRFHTQEEDGVPTNLEGEG